MIIRPISQPGDVLTTETPYDKFERVVISFHKAVEDEHAAIAEALDHDKEAIDDYADIRARMLGSLKHLRVRMPIDN